MSKGLRDIYLSSNICGNSSFLHQVIFEIKALQRGSIQHINFLFQKKIVLKRMIINQEIRSLNLKI